MHCYASSHTGAFDSTYTIANCSTNAIAVHNTNCSSFSCSFGASDNSTDACSYSSAYSSTN